MQSSTQDAGASYAKTTSSAKTYKVELINYNENDQYANRHTYGIYQALPTPSYFPESNNRIEGENWWDLGYESGTTEITINGDVGFWADYYYSNKDHYTVSLKSGQNWKTVDGNSYVFDFYFNTSNSSPSARIIFTPVEAGNGTGTDDTNSGTVGSPLPAPVVTLLIALGFGAALVMYRNRKAKA